MNHSTTPTTSGAHNVQMASEYCGNTSAGFMVRLLLRDDRDDTIVAARSAEACRKNPRPRRRLVGDCRVSRTDTLGDVMDPATPWCDALLLIALGFHTFTWRIVRSGA